MMKNIPKPLEPEMLALIDKLIAELPELERDADVIRRYEWLLDALIMRGQIPASYKRVAERLGADQRAKVRLELFAPDKYEMPSADVDCAAIMPYCNAKCCTLEVVLSPQDVYEKKVPWILDEPYVLPRNAETLKCTSCGTDGRCGIYEVRPAPCREYDCRNDKRIWEDFDKKILAKDSRFEGRQSKMDTESE